eukprot:NODE_382_length_8372_cov_0.676538.p6 type:complete len:174 gc:universal NODE_382_length_8372_cov_0.676538:738-217(-)
MLLNVIIAALSDCQNLKQFAIGLGMPKVNPTIMNEIITNCCAGSITRVTCVAGKIDSIDWHGLNLNGTFQANLPSSLVYLDLSSNQLTGNLPTTGYPVTLQTFIIYKNQLNGTIPVFPDGLTELSVKFNQITSFSTFPTNLTKLDLYGNNLKQPFPHDLPPNLETKSTEILIK